MKRSSKIILLAIGLGLVCFRLMIFAVEFSITDKQTLTLSDYVKQEPKGDWFEFPGGGTLDLTQATYFSFLGTGSAKNKVFIPVFPADDTVMTSPKVLVVSEDSRYMSRVNQLHKEGDEGAVLTAILRNPDAYYVKQPVIKGYRANLESRESDQLRERFPTVKIILEDKAGPPYGVAIVMVGIACVLLFFLVMNIRAQKEDRELEQFFRDQQALEKPGEHQ